jgi:hypothetical protein
MRIAFCELVGGEVMVGEPGTLARPANPRLHLGTMCGWDYRFSVPRANATASFPPLDLGVLTREKNQRIT